MIKSLKQFTKTRSEMVRGMAVAVGLAAVLALPGTGFAQNETPKAGGVLKIAHSTRIATMNVLNLSGPAEYPAIDMLYSGLTRIGMDNHPHPDLAESWSANSDATVFDFKLGEVGFALVIAWILFRLLRMFFDLFLDSWRSPAHDPTDLILGKLISLLFYGTLLLALTAISVTYLMLLIIEDPVESLSQFFPPP